MEQAVVVIKLLYGVFKSRYELTVLLRVKNRFRRYEVMGRW